MDIRSRNYISNAVYKKFSDTMLDKKWYYDGFESRVPCKIQSFDRLFAVVYIDGKYTTVHVGFVVQQDGTTLDDWIEVEVIKEMKENSVA